MLIQTLGLAAAQVFATAVGAFFQLTIMIFLLVLGSLALAHLHPFDQEGPQTVQVCCSRIACAFLCLMLWAFDSVILLVSIQVHFIFVLMCFKLCVQPAGHAQQDCQMYV